MNYLMKIGDVRQIPGKGRAIVGVNAELDVLSDDEIRRYIGTRIHFKYGENSVFEDVLDTRIMTSIGGGKNIALLIHDDGSNIPTGTLVYAVD